jgi:hypothetical protein
MKPHISHPLIVSFPLISKFGIIIRRVAWGLDHCDREISSPSAGILKFWLSWESVLYFLPTDEKLGQKHEILDNVGNDLVDPFPKH